MAGTLVANTINTDTGLFSTNNAYSGIAQAWVMLSLTGGATTINKSFNVSSVTFITTGQFTVNFATALTDGNYAVAGSSSWDSGNGTVAGTVGMQGTGTKTSSACTFFAGNGTGSALNVTKVSVVFFD